MAERGRRIKAKLRASLRALRHRNYRLFFVGQGISLIGTWMTRLASSWLVYRLTADPFLLGLVNFAGLVPTFILGAVAGVWVDRSRDLRRLVWITQLAGLFQSIGLTAIAVAHEQFGLDAMTTVTILIGLNVVQGIINAFDMPGRQTLMPRMITEPRDLANGIALNSSIFNGARLIGPAVAGVIIGLVGETWCFLLDAVSYIPVLWALGAMTGIATASSAKKGQRMFASIREGFTYAWGSVPIRTLLLQAACFSFLGMPYVVLLPIYAKEILGGGPSTLGLLTAAAGVGALGGAFRLAARESTLGLGRAMVVAGVGFSAGLAGFAFSRLLVLSMVLLAVVGYGIMTQSASCNTIIQTLVAPDKRGRVMSLFSVAWVGVAPFGCLTAGYMAKHVGAPLTLAACAVGCALATGAFARRLPMLHAALDVASTSQTPKAS